LHKKKYGKMTVSAWLGTELEHTNCLVAVLFGILLTVCAIMVRVWVGSPYRSMLELGIGEITPPVWLMTILWTLAFFINGCACGFVFAYRLRNCETEKYKGCFYFLLLAILELLWYPTLFGNQWVFLSILESILILCMSVATTVVFYRVTKLAGMLLLLHDIWLIYMLILNFAVFIGA